MVNFLAKSKKSRLFSSNSLILDILWLTTQLTWSYSRAICGLLLTLRLKKQLLKSLYNWLHFQTSCFLNLNHKRAQNLIVNLSTILKVCNSNQWSPPYIILYRRINLYAHIGAELFLNVAFKFLSPCSFTNFFETFHV